MLWKYKVDNQRQDIRYLCVRPAYTVKIWLSNLLRISSLWSYRILYEVGNECLGTISRNCQPLLMGGYFMQRARKIFLIAPLSFINALQQQQQTLQRHLAFLFVKVNKNFYIFFNGKQGFTCVTNVLGTQSLNCSYRTKPQTWPVVSISSVWS